MKRLQHRTTIPLHRYVIDLSSDDERVIGAVSAWIDPDLARRHEIDGGAPKIPIEIELLAGSIPAGFCGSPSRVPTAVFEDVEYHSTGSGTTLVFGGVSRVDVDLDSGRARGFVSPEHVESPWTISHRIFYMPVLEMLRGAGVYYVHAGCVCRGDRCVLLCGGSGRGKSTLTYALARAGFSYLSDDAVLIRNGGPAIEMFAFPEKIKLDDGSRAFFPEFDRFPGAPGKQEIPLGLTRIDRVAVSGRPDALIFIERRGGGEIRLRELDRGEALVRLISQSVSMAGRDSMEKNLDLLKRVAEASRSFELRLVEGFEGVPELIEEGLFR